MAKTKNAKASKPKRAKQSTAKTGIVKRVRSGKPVKGRGGFAEDVGSKVGGWLGGKAASLFKSITGLGDYRVQSNTLVAATDPPVLSNTTAATRVQHREYIGDISGTTAFTVNSYSINPGVRDTFPWLATVASAFEEYRIHGIIFEFKSTSADALNSTNTALGTVIMATEYNVLHNNFANKQEMENYVYSTSAPPSVSSMHPVECARDVNVLNNMYVRNAPPASPADLRFSDLGKFQIATVGMQAAAVIGELWCTYDVELIKPKMPDAFSSQAPTHYAHDVVAYGHTAISAASMYGTAGNKWKLLGNALTGVTLDTNTMSFTQSGRYLVLFCIAGTAAAASLYNKLTSSATTTAFNLFSNGSITRDFQFTAAQATLAGQTSTILGVSFDVSTGLTTPATLVWNGTQVVQTGNTLGDIFVIPLPNGFSKIQETIEDRLERLTATVRSLQHDGDDFVLTTTPPNTPVMSRSTILRHLGEALAVSAA